MNITLDECGKVRYCMYTAVLPSGGAVLRLSPRGDRYPTPDPIPTGCPICGAAVPLGATYCGKEHYMLAQKRISAATYGRTELDPLPAYSYPPPSAKR